MLSLCELHHALSNIAWTPGGVRINVVASMTSKTDQTVFPSSFTSKQNGAGKKMIRAWNSSRVLPFLYYKRRLMQATHSSCVQKTPDPPHSKTYLRWTRWTIPWPRSKTKNTASYICRAFPLLRVFPQVRAPRCQKHV